MLSDLKRLLKDTVIYGLGSLLPKAAGIILVPIYSRFLLPADYGIISLASMVTTMVSNVLILGQPNSLTLHVRQMESRGDSDEAGSLIFSSTLFVMLSASAFMVVLFAIGPYLTKWVIGQPEFTFKPYMQIALLTAYLVLPLGMIQAVNRSRQQSGVHAALQLSSFVLNTAITIYFVVALREGAFGSLKGNLGAALLLAPVALYLLVRNMRFRFSRTLLKQSLSFGLPLIPHFLAGWVLTFSDRWILSQYRSLTEVGLYSLAYNVSMVLNMAVMTINMAWDPIYYDLAATDEGRRKLPRLITVYAAGIGAIAMAFLLFSEEFLTLLTTERYYAAAPLMPIIVAGYFAFAMYVVMSTGIFYAKKTRLVPLISAFAAAVNIGLNLLLVPRYGMWAAAWTTLLAYTIMAVAVRFFAGRLFPGSFEDVRLAKLVGVFVVVFGLNWALGSLPLNAWIVVALKFGVYALALLSFVWLDIIALSEAKALVGRALAKKREPERTEDVADLQAAEETIEGAMSDDTGFGPVGR